VNRRALARTAAALALAASCAAGAAPALGAGRVGPAGPLRLTIAFTGDVSGYLEPCG
jgi:hypothetical protein